MIINSSNTVVIFRDWYY